MPRDPVCGKEIDEKDAAAAAQHEGKTYYIANGDRAAEQPGMPGMDLPESPFEVKERVGREEPRRKP
jgi:hypothetical protein